MIREKRLQKLGMHASDTALLAFQDVRVPASAVLGQVGKGFYHIMWELQGERMIGAAGAVAAAQHVFDRTLDAKERTAFGRPIGRFQVIRHKFAEMATKIETARQMVYTTAWRFQNGEYPVREITMAKVYSARIAVEVADECIQIHGGNGYMKEYGIERSWRDLRLNRIGAGSDEIMLEVTAAPYGALEHDWPAHAAGSWRRMRRQGGRARPRPADPAVHRRARGVPPDGAAVRGSELRPRAGVGGRALVPERCVRVARRARLHRAEVPGPSTAAMATVADAVFVEELAWCGSGGLAAGIGAHAGIALPPIWEFGTEEQKQRYLVPGSAARRSRRWRSPSPTPAPTSRRSAPTRARSTAATSSTASKTFITGGVRADVLVTAVKTDARGRPPRASRS